MATENLLLGEQVVYLEYGNHYTFKKLTPKEAKFYSEHNWCAFVRIKDDSDTITNYIDYVEFD